MTKSEFLHQLRSGLARLPPEETENAIRYYVEYLDEAGDDNWDQVQAELGSPQSIAAQILADYAMKDMNGSPPSARKGISAVWFVVLAIIAAPIALPLALAAAAVLLALFIAVTAIVFALCAVVLALFIVGVVAAIASFLVIPLSFPSFLLVLGLGLTCASLSVLLLLPTLFLAKAAFRGMIRLVNRLLQKRRGNHV